MEEFVPKMPNLHYFFRNRLSQLYKIMNFHKLDGLLLITSYDCSYSKPMSQLIKWLLFGYSSKTVIDDFTIPKEFNETFIIITLNQLFIFSLSSTRDFFYELTSKINNVELFITSKKEEEFSEILEVQKISKFIQWTQKIKRFGIPLTYDQRQNIVLLDRWPLLTATALDCLGLGFFTMNHEIVDISKDLEIYYHRIDLNAVISLINVKAEFLENTYGDFINYLQKEQIGKRLNTSEDKLNLNQELELIRLGYQEEKTGLYDFLKDLPDPRVLYGVDTNKKKNEKSSTDPLFKMTYDFKFPSFHLTYENMDPITGIRICRTVFLYNLQKKYLDVNEENFQYDFIPTKAYNEVFYFFNLYHVVVKFFREKQFDLVQLKTNVPKEKENLKNLLNEFTLKYIKDNELKVNYIEDFMIKPENIIIDIKKYVLLDGDKTQYQKENKIAILRIEVKNILSIFTHRAIGSLLFGDSFLLCFKEIFNLTSDILPYKFVQTSFQHFRDALDYNSQQILVSLTKIKIKDIEYKALQFYNDEYSIPYLFPDGHEEELDHNQMFVYYSGRINLYEDYFTFSDDSTGSVIVNYNNIEEISYSEETKCIVVLFKFKDMTSFPLYGLVKNEILFYFRGSTDRQRSYVREFLDFLRSVNCLNNKVVSINEDKRYEYEMVINTIYQNEVYNLNYISNSFNLTNISDTINNEMLDYEYLKYNHENKFLSFKEYKTKKEEFIEELNQENQKNKENNIKLMKKVMFLFGTNYNDVTNTKKKLVDFSIKDGYSPNIIIPTLNLFSHKDSKESQNKYIIKFYTENIKKIKSDKNIINFIFIYHNCNVLTFLSDINKKIPNLTSDFNILNISYCVNYSWMKEDRFKNKINHNLIYDEIINNIFINEGVISPNKITKNNKIISMSNPKAKIFTSRSFYLNEKEVKKIFEAIMIKPKIFDFYLNYYESIVSNESVYENIFIPFKYMVKEDLIKKFLDININTPLIKKWTSENKEIVFPPDDPPKPKLSDDDEYQKYLQKTASFAKISEIEPSIVEIFGNCVINNEESVKIPVETGKRTISEILCNYKSKTIKANKDLSYNETKNEIGLFILGKNLIFENCTEFYEKMLLTLAGEFPEFRPYQKKEDITEEEKSNINFVNMLRPLPPGWVLDGPCILDPQEEIHYEHPDLEKFIQEYIDINNKAIDEFNDKVQKEIDNLLI